MPADTRIMIAGDDATVAAHLQKVLERLGYRVATPVTSGKEAVEKAAETRPDLVLMDMALAGDTDGVEAARQVSARFGIPVVYIIRTVAHNLLWRARAAGPSAYIAHLFEEKSLWMTIEIVLSQGKFARAGDSTFMGQPGDAGGWPA